MTAPRIGLPWLLLMIPALKTEKYPALIESRRSRRYGMLVPYPSTQTWRPFKGSRPQPSAAQSSLRRP